MQQDPESDTELEEGKRRDFASQVEEEKQQEELSREDVLKLNKIHTRYQQAEIEDKVKSQRNRGGKDNDKNNENRRYDVWTL